MIRLFHPILDVTVEMPNSAEGVMSEVGWVLAEDTKQASAPGAVPVPGVDDTSGQAMVIEQAPESGAVTVPGVNDTSGQTMVTDSPASQETV